MISREPFIAKHSTIPGQFAPALVAGALAERVYLRGYILFISLWFLIVYSPLCHWIWASDGWLFNTGAAGVIDLAGGLVIHVSAGVSALIVTIYLGPRMGHPRIGIRPNNLVMTLMGAGLLWVGWFGFNAGSTLQSGLDSARALAMTQISAASEATGRTWTILEQLLIQLKGIGITILLAATATYIICIIVDKTIGFRIDQESEHIGLDQALHGERGYDFS